MMGRSGLYSGKFYNRTMEVCKKHREDRVTDCSRDLSAEVRGVGRQTDTRDHGPLWDRLAGQLLNSFQIGPRAGIDANPITRRDKQRDLHDHSCL